MNPPADTRLSQDSCSYNEKLRRTTGPGLYSLNVPYNDCSCKHLPDDPTLRYQTYGPSTCTMNKAVDDSSELLGLNYKLSKCSTDVYQPNKYQSTGCVVGTYNNARQCLVPREDTRLSNPTNTLRGTGFNRWEWLCYDPQDKALEEFDRVPVNYRMVAKDNHVPILDTPLEMSAEIPCNTVDNSDNLIKWQRGSARDKYAPGNPNGYINYNIKCK
jgi:hypothetical protein